MRCAGHCSLIAYINHIYRKEMAIWEKSLKIILGIFLILEVVEGLYPSSSDVVQLTDSTFQDLIKSDQVWLVEFFAPWCGHCQQLVPEYTKAAAALKGIAKVAAIDSDKYKQAAGQYGVSGFPTIKIFGFDKKKPIDFNGPRSAQGLADAVMKAVRDKLDLQLGGKKSGGGKSGGKSDVIELTDSNFDDLVLKSDDMWLVEFYAPWCGHCKNLAPHWESAASELKGKVKLGALDATVHTIKAQKYGIKGFPTIKYFPSGPKDDSYEDYDGGRTASDIINWANEKVAENIPAPEIKQITSNDVMKESCFDHPLCVVSILPHILDCQSSCRNKHLDMLNSLGEKYKKKMWGWVWAEAGTQPDVESALEIGGFGYPALTIVSSKKLKYATFKGSFSQTGINEFLRDVSYGKGSTTSIRGSQLPSAVKIDSWDGKDGVLDVPEDIDLSDVELEPLDKDEL